MDAELVRTATTVELAVSECSSYGGLSVHMGAAECSVHVMQLRGGLSVHTGAAVRYTVAVDGLNCSGGSSPGG